MARSVTGGKREQEKKRLAKRAEKMKKKEERQQNKATSFEDMIAYVDENGMLTSTPPEETQEREEINVEDIVIATPRREDPEEPTRLTGKVDHFNKSRGFGFIKTLTGGDRYFFHVHSTLTDVSEEDIVTFELERGVKGMEAVNVSKDAATGQK
jgi:cold shock CspA family protein